MKKLYVSMDESCGNGDGGDLRKCLTFTICIMGVVNWIILMIFTTTSYIDEKGENHYTTPLWVFLSINLIPIFMLTFWLFTTNDKYWNEKQEKKKQRMMN